MKYVLNLFGANVVAYNVAAALWQSPYQLLACFPGRSGMFFRFSHKYAKTTQSRHPFTEPGYLSDLIEFLKSTNSPEKILTFLTNDDAVQFWIEHEAALAPYCTVQTADLARFHHKDRFSQFLNALSIEQPATWPWTERESHKAPFLVKPVASDDAFYKRFHAKAKIVNTAEDLKSLKAFPKDALLCQDIIDFQEGDLYSWVGYRSKQGEVTSYVARHGASFPDKNGRVTEMQLVDRPAVQAMGNTMVEQLDYTGIANIQFIDDRKSEAPRVVEFNPRLWCGHALLLMNGINLVRRNADDYYQQKSSTECVAQSPSVPWYSVLDNYRRFNPFKIRCAEFYALGSDNLITKVFAFIFLVGKFVYYFTMRRSGDVYERDA